MIDTHTHLYVEEFDNDRDEVIQRAMAQGVTKFFLPAIDSETTERMLLLQQKYPANMFLMNGLHPCSVKENYETELSHIEELMNKHNDLFYAIGEIGIDLYWDKTFLEYQKIAFRKQIQLAKKHHLPIVIHCREAFDEIFEVLSLEKDEDLFGIFHCFSGNEQQAKTAISFGLKLGIGGVVTFKNGKIDTFLKNIDLKNIVLETDSPYLAPVPYRGKRNESAYILKVVEKLSDIYEIPEKEVIEITTHNAKQIFGI
ncbi:MAG: TatD family hydrolase [Capnocytophaga sp.]|nr:TatD family hydrolase [Capnocytophaga sp.]